MSENHHHDIDQPHISFTYIEGVLDKQRRRTHKFKLKDEKSRISLLKSMLVRSIAGGIMIAALILVILLGHTAVIFVIASIQLQVFREILAIAHSESKEKRLPWFRTTMWYFFVCLVYFLYGESMTQ